MTKFLLATVAFALAVPASAATLTQTAANPLDGGIAGGARFRAFDLSPTPTPSRCRTTPAPTSCPAR